MRWIRAPNSFFPILFPVTQLHWILENVLTAILDTFFSRFLSACLVAFSIAAINTVCDYSLFVVDSYRLLFDLYCVDLVSFAFDLILVLWYFLSNVFCFCSRFLRLFLFLFFFLFYFFYVLSPTPKINFGPLVFFFFHFPLLFVCLFYFFVVFFLIFQSPFVRMNTSTL